jgi:hypothetical protein
VQADVAGCGGTGAGAVAMHGVVVEGVVQSRWRIEVSACGTVLSYWKEEKGKRKASSSVRDMTQET